MNKDLNSAESFQIDKQFLNISLDRLEVLKAFKLLILKNSDTSSIKQNVYSAPLTAGIHSFTEVTCC